MKPSIHPTAEIEPGVEIGDDTSIWNHVHVRGPTRIGSECIVGEKTYIAYGVEVGDRVKLNAFVYVCNSVFIEDGVMVGAGAVFTNDRFPRATTPDLRTPRDSGPGDHIETTHVRRGATLGAACVIGPGLEIGQFSMVGMAATVTRDVPPFHLVVGSPAETIAYVCRCGHPVVRTRDEPGSAGAVDVTCAACGLGYTVEAGRVTENSAP